MEIEYVHTTLEKDHETIQFRFDKMNEKFYEKWSDGKDEMIKVMENGTYYYILPSKRKFAKEEKADFRGELNSSLMKTEYLEVLFAALKKDSNIKSEFKEDTFELSGKVTKEESSDLEGDFLFANRIEDGIVKEVQFRKDGEVKEMLKCTQLNLQPNLSSSFLPDLTGYKEVQINEITR